jgi:hypothetical protein
VQIGNTASLVNEEAGFQTAGEVMRHTTNTTLLMNFEPIFGGGNVRFFMGFAAATLSTMISASNPAVDQFGLSFDSSIGDAGSNTLRLVHSSAGAPTRVDTGVDAQGLNELAVQFVWNSTSSIAVTIYNAADLTTVLFSTTVTTNVPNADMRFMAGYEVLAPATLRSFRVAALQISNPLP